MSITALPYAAPFVALGLLLVGILVVAVPYRRLPGVRWLIVFLSALCLWTFSYAAEVAVAGMSAKLFTAKLQYLGIATVPPAWLFFAMEYTGVASVRARLVAALYIFPSATIALAWTNELHPLIYADIGLTSGEAYRLLVPTYGVWFWLNVGYAYLCLLAGMVSIFRAIFTRSHLFRRQAVVLVVATLAPWLGNFLYITGMNPTDFDLTVVGFAISGVLMAWVILRWSFLSIGAIGRDTIVEGLAEPVVVMDAECRVVDLNRAAARVLGASPQDVVGVHGGLALSALQPRFDRDQLTRRTVEGLADGRTYDMQIEPLRDSRGRFTGWTVLLIDVTERAEQAASLERARVIAEQTANAQWLFLVNVNHELRTPLNGVLGAFELLLDSELDEEQRAHALVGRSSGEILLALVDRVMHVATLETGRIDLDPTRFDLATTCQEAVAERRAALEGGPLRVAFRADPEIPVWLIGDAGRVREILDALLDNAIKFTDAGSVEVELTLEALTETAATVRLEVRDTGIGIPAEHFEAILEPLFQVDQSHTRRHGGAGLGLTIVRRVSERMGGAIKVESEVGEGSSFLVSIPFELP